MSYPLVAKPDVGERGDFIKIIHSPEELLLYAKKLKRPYLVQEFITDSFEAGVMVIKDPQSQLTRVTSVVTKGFLSVRGDGKASLEELVSKIPRARFQWNRLIELGWDPKKIPQANEEIILEKIGNHKRGTTFLNGNHLITNEVLETAKKIASQTPGFFFGRFDLKAPSEKEFKMGRGWKIMELNGAFSEPGHIYDPKNNLLSAWRDLVIHWLDLADISSKSPQKPSSFMSFVRVWLQYRQRS
ncbi:MAG: hypothetical protein K2P81_10475 [Bacteriovoracaceae bacterium]|nr:hypothetical protein [Bacteriovoracaceae bacterium]